MSGHRTYRIGESVVTVGDSWTVTRYPDGTEVHAHPDGSEFQAAAAESLGYPNAGAMTRDHDAAHALIAHTLGTEVSPTIWGVAHGTKTDALVVKSEEALALLLQRVSQVGLAVVLEDFHVEEVNS